jgi:hypothetical protein
MKRYPIVVVKSKRLYQTLPYKTPLSRKAYLSILRWGRQYEVWDEIYPSIELVCAKCKSFSVDAYRFCRVIDDLLDESVYKEFESDPVYCGIVARVMRVLDGNLNDAWNAVYCSGTDEFTDYQEIAVILNPDCCCYSLFVGTDPVEQVIDEPDYSRDPNISVVKWIGPRQQRQYIPIWKNDKKEDTPLTLGAIK